MEGAHLRAGAVAALRDILPAVSVTRRWMEKTPHVLLVGKEPKALLANESSDHNDC
jgi:isoaspartyl peptidase/L-asparaginase-like protein (Ntn-hydrolase superfamily)